jgi:hypothetical protein
MVTTETNMAFENIHPSYVEDFKSELRRHKRRVDEFKVSATPLKLLSQQANVISPIVGTITIKNRTSGVERTYDTGHGTNWVARFSGDLAAGVF